MSKVFVYKGAGSDGLAALQKEFVPFYGKLPDGVVDFGDFSSAKNLAGSIDWGFWCWSKEPRLQVCMSVGLATGDVKLADAATGKLDATWEAIAKSAVTHGHANAYMRLGWEFNGGWYPWGGHDPKNVAAAFRRAVGIMRAVPGANFRFVWCPALYMQGFWPDEAYPGDDVVDLIGVDAYATSWGQKDPAKITSDSVTSTQMQWNVYQVAKFAAKHGKPTCYPEWGTGDEPSGYGACDYAPFIQAMKPYVDASEFAGYWDYNAGDYNSKISTGQRPNAAAAFLAAFNPPVVVPVAPPAPVLPQVLAKSNITTATVNTTNRPDGSAVLTLDFPLATKDLTYTISFTVGNANVNREVGFYSTAKDGLSGNYWFSGHAFTWVVKAGTTSHGTVYVGPK